MSLKNALREAILKKMGITIIVTFNRDFLKKRCTRNDSKAVGLRHWVSGSATVIKTKNTERSRALFWKSRVLSQVFSFGSIMFLMPIN